MGRKSKLRPAQIRKIYRSPETAKELAEHYGISQQLVYLIRSGRAHEKFTKGLTRQNRSARLRATNEPMIDINALADAIIDRLVKRLRL